MANYKIQLLAEKYAKEEQQKIEELEKEVETLNKIIKEAINLPKGIEPHSYSDYKINKQ